MLYPQDNEIRQLKDLSGLWKFKVDKKGEGYGKKWYENTLSDALTMPVPASYNDITQDIAIRDHLGDAWYERMFYVPQSWAQSRVFVRVGSASHRTTLWINGKEVTRYKGGFLPFEKEITHELDFERENRITLAVNNILDLFTLPPGRTRTLKDHDHPAGYKVFEYFHDFFNYSGIHRPVFIYSVPKNYIKDVSVRTDISGKDGIIDYNVELSGSHDKVRVFILDDRSREIAECAGTSNRLKIKNARLWNPGKPCLYTMVVEALEDGRTVDIYRLPVGIRTIKVTNKEFLINGKPFYFKGFGKHEDSDIRGKGHDNALNVKDFNLIKWLSANSFRTSHYPYSDEIMQLADREGVVIIDEAPAVGLWEPIEKEVFSDKLLQYHCQVLKELVERDRNHPSVVMWSLSNESATEEKSAQKYFRKLAETVRKLDDTRPITVVECKNPLKSNASGVSDVICVNRYYSWYTDPGELSLIEYQLEKELRVWYSRFRKPVILSEFGADTIAGFHSDPPVMFTEEYQCEMVMRCCKTLDKLDFIVGEHVWNFADFATKQEPRRVMGNRKGIFTRQRQPKMLAHMLRKRWEGI